MSCPVLHTLLNESWLRPDPEGCVSTGDLSSRLRQMGLDPVSTRALVEVARLEAGVDGDKVDLKKLLHGHLKHNADFSRSQKIFQLMGERDCIGAQELARAADERLREDPGLHGRLQGGAELLVLLVVFGELRGGKLVLTRDTLKSLYLDHRFPAGWSPRPANELVAPLEAARYAFTQAMDFIRPKS